MRIPFWFALTDADEYGTPFVATDDAFGSTAELNGVLASILAASMTYATFGFQLPPTGAAYKIKAIHNLVSDDTDDDIEFGIWDGAAFNKLYVFVNGSLPSGVDKVEFGDGITVPSGYKPAFRYTGAGSATVTGQIEWALS